MKSEGTSSGQQQQQQADGRLERDITTTCVGVVSVWCGCGALWRFVVLRWIGRSRCWPPMLISPSSRSPCLLLSRSPTSIFVDRSVPSPFSSSPPLSPSPVPTPSVLLSLVWIADCGARDVRARVYPTLGGSATYFYCIAILAQADFYTINSIWQ